MNPKSQSAQSNVRAQHRCAPACPDVSNSPVSRSLRIVRSASLVLAIALSLSLSSAANSPAPNPATPAPDQPPTPILLELFTSEGCSTCPPADDFVQRLDASQPVPGAQLIVLGEHVDYWDHDGWRDPYSSPQFTERQAGYVHALGLPTPYTPQMIVDGYIVLKGSPSDIEQTFAKQSSLPKIPIRIASATIDAPSQQLKLKIEADAPAPKQHGGIVWIAVALDHAASQVSAGENNGKHLEHVAVVTDLKKLGKLEKGKQFSQESVLKLNPATDPKNLRLIAFIQEPNEGKILGATAVKVSTP